MVVGSALPAFSTCICVIFLETSTQGSEQVLGVEEHFLPHLISPSSHQRGNREQSPSQSPCPPVSSQRSLAKGSGFSLFAGAGPLTGRRSRRSQEEEERESSMGELKEIQSRSCIFFFFSTSQIHFKNNIKGHSGKGKVLLPIASVKFGEPGTIS